MEAWHQSSTVFNTHKEQNVSAKVARHTPRVLRQWHKEQWKDCRANVPRGCRPVQPWEVILRDAEFCFHLNITRTVGASRQAGQDGAMELLAIRSVSVSVGVWLAMYSHETSRKGKNPFSRHGPIEAANVRTLPSGNKVHCSYGFSGSLGPSQSTISTSSRFSGSLLMVEESLLPFATE